MLDDRAGYKKGLALLLQVAYPISCMHLGTKLTPGKLERSLIQASA